MKKPLLILAATLGLSGLAATAQADTTVFSTNFDSVIPTEITPGANAALAGVQGYAGLGPAGNQFGGSFLRSATANVVTLTLTGLPAHSAINLDFLFAAIDSLDGTGTFPQGDFFKVTLDGTQMFRESFANALASQIQSYAPEPGIQLARMVDLGFAGPGGFYTDSAYNLGADSWFGSWAHTGSTATFTFQIEGPGIQPLSDESWAMDNLSVSITPVPEPASYAMFLAGLGLIGFVARRRRQGANLVVAGGLSLSLMAGYAQAQTPFLDPRTSVDFSAVEWSGSTPTSTNYSSIIPGKPLSPQTYGSPAVNATNLFTWSASNVGAHNAYASTTPSMQTLRSAVAVSSVGGTEYDGTLKSAFQGQIITIGAGTSGLATGAPVTLNFMLHLGGTLAVGNSSYPPGVGIALPSTYGYAASAAALLDYEVYALGQDSPTAAFHYEGNATYGYYKEPGYDILTDTFSSYGRYSTDGTWNWTDLATNDAYDHSVSPVPLSVWAPGSPGSSREHVINAGVVTLSINAQVGDTFEILGSLTTEAKAWGNLRMTAMSDFGSTFDADITATTPGIEIIGIQAGIAPVPEPEAYAMFLAGLGLIGFVARRRQRGRNL